MWVGVIIYRTAKTSAQQLISDSVLVTPHGGKEEEEEEESDDSLVGEHSPFIRQITKSRCVNTYIVCLCIINVSLVLQISWC